MTGNLERKAGTVGKHDGPLGHSEGSDLCGSIGGGDASPTGIGWSAEEVGWVEGDSEQTTSVYYDGDSIGRSFRSIGSRGAKGSKKLRVKARDREL